ncbi:hypothetical protein AB6A40_002069 [Gnathostoma spinigerum]|uniref:Glutathione peroxidase n=1 Tax=Gnathostoma spinigerum TaxID=75299 RepID=A0ABD6EGC3_9BILA
MINVPTLKYQISAYTQQYLDFGPFIDINSKANITILAFPCDQFHLQEPAENHEILNGLKYVRPGNGFQLHKNLHIFGKLEVNGENQHPLYEFMKDLCPQTTSVIGKRSELIYDPIRENDITWNFEKFLVDRQENSGLSKNKFIDIINLRNIQPESTRRGDTGNVRKFVCESSDVNFRYVPLSLKADHLSIFSLSLI